MSDVYTPCLLLQLDDVELAAETAQRAATASVDGQLEHQDGFVTEAGVCVEEHQHTTSTKLNILNLQGSYLASKSMYEIESLVVNYSHQELITVRFALSELAFSEFRL